MKPNYHSIQSDYNPRAIAVQARLLMSERRQKVQHREQSMLNRAASEVRVDA